MKCPLLKKEIKNEKYFLATEDKVMIEGSILMEAWKELQTIHLSFKDVKEWYDKKKAVKHEILLACNIVMGVSRKSKLRPFLLTKQLKKVEHSIALKVFKKYREALNIDEHQYVRQVALDQLIEKYKVDTDNLPNMVNESNVVLTFFKRYNKPLFVVGEKKVTLLKHEFESHVW